MFSRLRATRALSFVISSRVPKFVTVYIIIYVMYVLLVHMYLSTIVHHLCRRAHLDLFKN